MAIKLTVIGGGSSRFVPALVRQMVASELLGDSTITLMDVDEGRLRAMQALAEMLIATTGARVRVEIALNQRKSLRGADFVVTTVAAGGTDAWEKDIEIPARYGLIMHVADSVGPGGIMRALRNAPILAAVARDVAEVAPDAFIFNYANPASVAAMALGVMPEVRSVSLCDCTWVPRNTGWLAWKAGVQPEDIAMPPVVGGINHCSSIIELRLRDGRDALALARARAEQPVEKWALETYGVLPYCWTHWVEFHPQMQYTEDHYNGRAQGLRVRYGMRVRDTNDQRDRVKQLQRLTGKRTGHDREAVTPTGRPPGVDDLGVEVIDIIEAIVENRNDIRIVNTLNRGAIPNLPADTIVEVNASVSAYGIRPIYAGALPEPLAAHLRPYVALQKQVLKAALSGDRQAALQAFLLEPTIAARLDLDQTEALLDEMLAAHAAQLPLFN